MDIRIHICVYMHICLILVTDKIVSAAQTRSCRKKLTPILTFAKKMFEMGNGHVVLRNADYVNSCLLRHW